MANGNAGTEAKNVAGAITSMGIDELISKLAIGIARGQLELDRVCMEIAQFMGEAQIAFGKRPDSDEPDLMSLIELGFTPNFYQFVDTVLEVRVAVSSKLQETREYNTSDARAHTESRQQQSQYESSRRDSYGGSGYSAGGWGAGGWGWGAWGYGQSSYGYSSASESSAGASSSIKSTSLALTTVDAKYASTYNYAVEASSLIKTKIVPVPPPEVFEEIVRAKIKERREFEQRARWRDQSIAIMSTVAGAAQNLIGDAAKLPDLATNYARDTAVALQDALKKLSEEHGRLSTDHWAVIDSLGDRTIVDAAMDKALAGAAKILERYPVSPAAPDDPALVESLIADIETNLERLRDKANEIAARLAPPPAETPQP